MASYLQVENLSKHYGDKILFSGISFNINKGDKIALIAPNGTGKSSLLKILAGKESSDSGGEVKFMQEITIAYLEQNPIYNRHNTLFEEVLNSLKQSNKAEEWQYEHKVREILTSIGLQDSIDKQISSLSGGELKRAAISSILLKNADLIILDEPTNHLDIEAIEFLERQFIESSCTLLMVTHDRYFLDRICNGIIELDRGNLYHYKGNYSYFLEKRAERMEQFNTEIERARNLYRNELEWMRRMPQARGTKSKSRVNAFYDIKGQAGRSINEKAININIAISRMGNKVVNCKNISHPYSVKDFSYNFAKQEKVGIIGANGVGKSTFLDMITGSLDPKQGSIDVGETVVFGYYTQRGLNFRPEDTVIDIVREIAEVATIADGKQVSISQFLNYFLFPPNMQFVKVDKLSGGEKRRLHLVTILMKNPNFLILDEPTNDLDIVTLNVLEEYLKTFNGSLIVVSHDRYFLDKITDHTFVFKNGGEVKDFPGNYSDYHTWAEEEKKRNRSSLKNGGSGQKMSDISVSEKRKENKDRTVRKKLSYKEQQEYASIENEIQLLEKEKATLETLLSSGLLTTEELFEKSERVAIVIKLIDQKSDRWIELSENI